MANVELFYRKYFNTHLKKIQRILYMDTELAYDVVQEAYCRAIKYEDHYDKKIGPYKSWFNRILYNTLRDFQKKHQLSVKIVDGEVDDYSSEDHLNVLIGEAPNFEDQLDEIKNSQHRKIVVLHYIVGYSCKEIAQAEGTTVNNVTTICSRFRAKLKGD